LRPCGSHAPIFLESKQFECNPIVLNGTSSPELSLFGFLERKYSKFSFNHKAASIAVGKARKSFLQGMLVFNCRYC